MINFILFLCLMCLSVCCLSSSIFLSGWMWEAKKINDLGMCNFNETLEGYVLCPLKDDILKGDRQKIIKKKYDENKLDMNDLLNDYYVDGQSNTKFIYCDENVTKCTITMNQSGTKYNLIEDIVYVGSYESKGKPKTCLYMPVNLVTGVLLSEKILSVDEFILKIKGVVQDFKPAKYKNISPDERDKHALNVLFVEFPYDGLATTFKETIYRKLEPEITSAYFDILKKKINNKESLTTFEFFSYFAILAISDNSIYKVLKF